MANSDTRLGAAKLVSTWLRNGADNPERSATWLRVRPS